VAMAGIISYLSTPKVLGALGVAAVGLTYYIYRKVTVKDTIYFFGNGDCCPPGSEPGECTTCTDYKEQGNEITLNGLSLYTVGKGSKVIIMVSDIFGWKSGRHREMCDQFATQGYRVVLPDLFHGTAKDAPFNIVSLIFKGYSFYKRMKSFPWSKLASDIHGILIPYLEKEGATSIGCIGFCWGAWVIWHAAASDKIRCGVCCHPSLQVTLAFGEDVKQLTEKIQSPQLLLPAGNDSADLKKNGKVVQILQKKNLVEVSEFPTVKHGFVTRGDLRDNNVSREVQRALDLSMSFFRKHL